MTFTEVLSVFSKTEIYLVCLPFRIGEIRTKILRVTLNGPVTDPAVYDCVY